MQFCGLKKMQAGTGSSIHRNKYLAYHFGIDEKDVEIGAKGTDLFVKLKSGDIVSLAEIQILQAISDAEDEGEVDPASDRVEGGSALIDFLRATSAPRQSDPTPQFEHPDNHRQHARMTH